MSWSEIKYFTKAELACSCCGECRMDMGTVQRLDDMRAYVNHPIIVNSGYRCPAYNNKVSSTGFDGPHTTGKCADLSVSIHRARNFVEQCVQRFSGIGIKAHGDVAGRFVHVDELERRIWTYS